MDLSFVRKMRRQKRTEISAQTKPTIILVLMDLFSRFCQLRILPDQRAVTVQRAVREAIPFFLPVTRRTNNFSHLLSDRGISFFSLSSSIRPLVRRSDGPSVMMIELEFPPLPTRPRLVLTVYPALFFLIFLPLLH